MNRRDREREEKLEDLRRQADAVRDDGAGGTVAGQGVHAAGGPMPATGSGYYGLPVLKPPVWTWEVSLYFFVGGTAGAAAVLAAAFDVVGGAPMVARRARGIALAGALLSPALLISDLGRPERFLNMMRVFKWRSPMSMGSWILAAFGGSVTLSVGAHELLGADSLVGRAAAVVAALSGSLLATYTGVLLGATAIPVWHSHRSLLPAHFGAAALGSAVSVLTLCGCEHPGLDALGVATAAVECGVGAVLESQAGAEHRPLHHGRSGQLLRLGGLLTGPVALGLRLLGARRAASWCFVAGAVVTRFGWIEAGRASAGDAAALFEMQSR